MRYELTLQVLLNPEADFAGTDDEIENVYLLVESAVKAIDDLEIELIEVRDNA
jgi:hypothetical protein